MSRVQAYTVQVSRGRTERRKENKKLSSGQAVSRWTSLRRESFPLLGSATGLRCALSRGGGDWPAGGRRHREEGKKTVDHRGLCNKVPVRSGWLLHRWCVASGEPHKYASAEGHVSSTERCSSRPGLLEPPKSWHPRRIITMKCRLSFRQMALQRYKIDPR